MFKGLFQSRTKLDESMIGAIKASADLLKIVVAEVQSLSRRVERLEEERR